MKEWTVDGPGASQAELTYIINSLSGNPATILPVDRRYSSVELMEHEALLVRNEILPTRRAVLAQAAFRAHAMHRLEKYSKLVEAWQRLKLEGFFVHNS